MLDFPGTFFEDFGATQVLYDETRDNWVLIGEEFDNNTAAYLLIDRATRTLVGSNYVALNIGSSVGTLGDSDNAGAQIIGGAVLSVVTGWGGSQRQYVAFDADPDGNSNARLIKGCEPPTSQQVRVCGDRLVFRSSGSNFYYTQRWAP